MPVVGPLMGVYVLVRLAGSLQKYLFAPINREPMEREREKVRRLLSHKDPEVRDKARQLLHAMDIVLGTWDWAEGIAYDDPVEMLADLAALGVKLHLFRAGVKFFPRILQAGGAKVAIQGIEVMFQAFGAITGGELDPASLTKFVDRFTDTKELFDDGSRLAAEGFDLLSAAVDLSADIASGRFLAIPGGLGHIVVQAGEFFASLVGFAQRVEGSVPDPRTAVGFAEDVEKAGRAKRHSKPHNVVEHTTREQLDLLRGVVSRRPRAKPPRPIPTGRGIPTRDPETVAEARTDLRRLRGTLRRSRLRQTGRLDILGELKRGR